MSYRWGIDLGGTKVEGVIIDPDKPDENGVPTTIIRKRIASNATAGYQAILNSIKELVDLLKQETSLEPANIGFGTPGIIDPSTQLMKNCNSTALNGMPLSKDLQDLLQVQIKIANDANCFALAEHNFGAAKSSQSSFGVIMGTGVGGGAIIAGHIIEGHQGIAGEWGHTSADDQTGTDCYCGNRGCVETIISGPALENYYKAISGKELKLNQIALENDPYAEKTIDRLCYFFGKSLAYVVNILDPEVVVLGGGLSNIEQLYDEGIKQLEKFVFNKQCQTKVVKNQLGDSAGVYGAALLI